MPELKFDTGIVSYSLNGAVEVSFNPTDMSFIHRILRTFDLLAEKQDEYDGAAKNISSNQELFEWSRKIDSEMREVIDKAFEKPVCEELFGSMNVYAFASGAPVWFNLIFSVYDLFDEAVTSEAKKTSPHLSKYIKKYHK